MVIILWAIAANHEILDKVSQMNLLLFHPWLFHFARCDASEDVERLEASRESFVLGVQETVATELLPELSGTAELFHKHPANGTEAGSIFDNRHASHNFFLDRRCSIRACKEERSSLSFLPERRNIPSGYCCGRESRCDLLTQDLKDCIQRQTLVGLKAEAWAQVVHIQHVHKQGVHAVVPICVHEEANFVSPTACLGIEQCGGLHLLYFCKSRSHRDSIVFRFDQAKDKRVEPLPMKVFGGQKSVPLCH
mmetsp:Transcript_53971/g.97171  ORF Transcript_53971/g.97171 Transcript_53971/m.97171 type:complete len:250 (-) Transcript_53971:600-1349(-)